MSERVWGNEYRSTVVCIDRYEGGVPAGRFYNPYLDVGIRFESITQFILRMESLLDQMKLPQAHTAARSFSAPPPDRAGGTAATESHKGELATFSLRIIFRQNASWQGSVAWLETGQEQSFRSALELILLLDSALSEARAA